MRRFLTSRLFRACVCLILVCCVLVLNSPIRVQAVLATSTAILIGAAAVLILGTMGIVLAPKTESEFAAVGQDLSEWMYNAAKKPDSQITDIQVGIWLEDVGAAMGGGKDPDPLKPSVWDVFITTQFMLWAQEFLSDKTVTVPIDGALPPGTVIPAGQKVNLTDGYWYICSEDVMLFKAMFYSTGGSPHLLYLLAATNGPVKYQAENGVTYSSTVSCKVDDIPYYLVGRAFGTWSDADRAGSFTLSGTYSASGSLVMKDALAIGLGGELTDYVPTDYYMTPEYIQEAIQENISAIEALKAWSAGDPVEVPDIEYGNILTETQTLTESVAQIQTQLAQGNMTLQQYLDTLTNGSGVNFNGGGTGSGGNDPSTPTPPSSDIAPFMLDLKDFFPFCIPFDLYKFFSLLCAEPEAPVFTWVVQDLSGNSYPISVDLSKWDNFAALFRKLQLFVFIIGLAMSSRKFIKW